LVVVTADLMADLMDYNSAV